MESLHLLVLQQRVTHIIDLPTHCHRMAMVPDSSHKQDEQYYSHNTHGDDD